jgi:hypothetical protein
MSFAGWIIFTLAVGTMTALFLWCIFKVLRGDGSAASDSNSEKQ